LYTPGFWATQTPKSKATKQDKAVRDAALSKDGKWRSYPKVPGLMQYTSTGIFFARVRVDGKLIRQALKDGNGQTTTNFNTAKLLMGDFRKGKIREAARPVAGTFAEARRRFESELERDHTLGEGSRNYRTYSIRVIAKTWPELDGTPLRKITVADCQAWAKRFSEKYDEQYFNNTLSTLRSIIEAGGLFRDENPARKIKRLGVKPTILQLPEPDQFHTLVEKVQTAGSRFSKDCART
jgi:hypothetical protein